MRAVRFGSYGGPEVLRVVEVPEPRPREGEVLVDLRAAGLNPADSKRRRGTSPAAPLPAGTGREFAGVVTAVGEGVPAQMVGDEVFGTSEGVICERFALPLDLVAMKPTGLDWQRASCIPVAAQTAWMAVESQRLGPADTVLVSAATGGVGFVAAQLAVRTGATVIGTASTDSHTLLRSIGVIPCAYGSGLADRLRELAPAGLTAVLDHHGPETIEAALALGVDRSRINTTSGYGERYAVPHVGRVGLDRAVTERIADELVAGTLVLPIEAEYALDDIVEAYRHLDAGHVHGKLVVSL